MELFEQVARMLHDRYTYYENEGNYERQGAYDSAYDMVMYALQGNAECLNQMDYFNKED